jgi:hypothetical protein
VGAAACGGGDDGDQGSSGVDASYSGSDGPRDAAAPCDHDETDETGNGNAPETGAAYAGTALTLCGRVDPGQDTGDDLDTDRYTIEVAAEVDVLVRTTAPLASRVGTLEVALVGAGGSRVFVDHGVFSAHLTAGSYELAVVAREETARTEAFAYRIEIAPDAPDARCPVPARAPDHVEIDEASKGHRGNDMVEVRRSGAPLRAITAAADAPDATGLVLSASDVATVTGTSAAIASAGDGYHDRDTFLVATGARTNQLELRLGWTPTADLDVLVFPAGSVGDIAGAATVGAGTGEVMITAVAPSSAYWVWVGAARGGAAAAVGYALTLCATQHQAL